VEIDLHNFLNRHWKPIVTALVKEGKIREYLPTYNTRHTFISLCLDAGIGVAQIAEWVGNSPEIILKNYAGAVRKVEVPSF
jgi:integrase